MENEQVHGLAKDGTRFTAESPEVQAELEAHPDLSLEAAIGNVVMAYEQSLAPAEEAPAEEPAVEEAPAEEEASEEAEAPAEAEEATEEAPVAEESAPEAEQPAEEAGEEAPAEEPADLDGMETSGEA